MPATFLCEEIGIFFLTIKTKEPIPLKKIIQNFDVFFKKIFCIQNNQFLKIEHLNICKALLMVDDFCGS